MMRKVSVSIVSSVCFQRRPGTLPASKDFNLALRKIIEPIHGGGDALNRVVFASLKGLTPGLSAARNTFFFLREVCTVNTSNASTFLHEYF